MKLLLLGRSVDRTIIAERQTEFFGPWAQLIESPEDLSKPAFEPYPTSESVYNTSINVINIAGDIFKSLVNILPDLTGIKAGSSFWKLLLADHIIVLAGIIEDIRIRHLSLPEEDYILGLPDYDYSKEVVPYSWNDASRLLTYDDYFRWHAMSLYLKDYYNKHENLRYLKIQQKKIADGRQLYTIIFHHNYKRFLKKLARTHLSIISKFLKKELDSNIHTLIWDEYRLEKFAFKRFKNACLFEENLVKVHLPFLQVDRKKRHHIERFLPHPYGELMSVSLPLVALEGLPYLIGQIEEKKYLHKFRNIERIYTNGQGFRDEGLKRALLALLADSGKKIISIQHGGGSTYFAHSGNFLERRIADEYICWGAGYSNLGELQNANRIKSIPSMYLSMLKQRNILSNKKKWDVLFVVLEENRYIKWLYSPLFPDMAYDYFRRQKELFDYFSKKKRVAVKTYPETYGWGQANWIKTRYSGFKLLTSGNFTDFAFRSKVVIIDYNSTAFLEMLAIRRPFLTTWNRRWFRGNDFFERCIDKLIDVGVFYEQPDALINSYERIVLSDINLWWREKKRQNAIIEMSDNFAMTSERIEEEWVREFENNDLMSSRNKR